MENLAIYQSLEAAKRAAQNVVVLDTAYICRKPEGDYLVFYLPHHQSAVMAQVIHQRVHELYNCNLVAYSHCYGWMTFNS